jgi:hypothetical protein
MSIPSSELQATLKQARSAKRTEAHDRWMGMALGAVLDGADTQAPETGADAGSAVKPKRDVDAARKEWQALQARCTQAMSDLTLHALAGPVYLTAMSAQKDLKKAMDACADAAKTADGADLPARVDDVTDKLAVAETTRTTLDDKVVQLKRRDVYLDRVVMAKFAEDDAPPWLESARLELVAADKGFDAAPTADATRALVATLVAKLDPAEAQKRKWIEIGRLVEGTRPALDRALKDMTSGDAALKKLKSELKTALDAYDQGIVAAGFDAARNLAQPVHAKLREITLGELGGPGASAAAKRKKLMEQQDPALQKAIMNALAADKTGREELDKIVGDIGGSANKAEKKLIEAALVARFGLDTLKGDLTTKALPRLYKVMKDLPDSHTKYNQQLKHVERHRKSGEGASWYQDKMKTVELNLEETGNVGRVGIFRRNEEKLNKTKVKSFDTTALHEIGHAVDQQWGFMKGKSKVVKYGGWEDVQIDDVVEIAGSKAVLKASPVFFEVKDFKPLGKPFLSAYLKQALLGQDAVVKAAASADADALAKDPAIAEATSLFDANKKATGKVPEGTQVKLVAQSMKKCKVKDKEQQEIVRKIVTAILRDGPKGDPVKTFLAGCKIPNMPPKVDWDALAAHPAVQWCREVRLNGAHDGLWSSGKAGAQTHAVDNKVYQESYKDKWACYDVGARSHEVSNYQFRAAAEWFAEIYAAYYQGLLSPSHVDAKWFKPEVHERTNA